MPAERSRQPAVRSTLLRRQPVRPVAAGLLAAALGFALPRRRRACSSCTSRRAATTPPTSARARSTTPTLYRAAQADALMLPNAALTGSATRSETQLPHRRQLPLRQHHGLSRQRPQPLYRANRATIEQATSAGTVAARPGGRRAGPDRASGQAYFDVLAAQDTLASTRTRRRRSPSSWPRPSATSRSAPRPSPTRARRRRASTW